MKKNLILLVVMLALAAGAYYMFSKDSKSTIANNPLSDFSIEDTASVSKLIIVDKIVGNVTLTRNGDHWMLNNEYMAKQQSINLCLGAIKNIKVKGSVGERAKESIIARASGAGRKIEIYTTDSKMPEKIWISAGNTPDHHGDFFILQLPGQGISPDPFRVDLPMFDGYITARFHTVTDDWRFSGVFNYPNIDFKEVCVSNTVDANQSFCLELKENNKLELKTDSQGVVLDTLKARDFLLNFKKIHLEKYNTSLTDAQEDSVFNRTPDWEIKVIEKDNTENLCKLYYTLTTDKEGETVLSRELMYGTVDDEELFRIQLATVFRPLLIGSEDIVVK